MAAILAAALFATLVPPAVAVDKELREARQELKETKERIRARAKRMRMTERRLNRLATEIVLNESVMERTRHRMGILAEKIRAQEAALRDLEEKLALQAREAYITGGTGAPIVYVFTASSPAEVASRLSFLDEVSRRDSLLADRVQLIEDRLSEQRAAYVGYLEVLQTTHERLKRDRKKMNQALRRSRAIFATLRSQKDVILNRISEIRPFAVCPVGTPRAITDSFGIWVQRSKARGGDHVHQGDDIMAPAGTPIYAPFDGNAVDATNRLGGNAVNVYGEHGYVYNAHLSRFGKLGPVEAGDIVGYIGATGNTGANHNHFEWHPDDGDAVDPYPFLMMVC